MASQKENLRKLEAVKGKIIGQIERLNSEVERLKAQLSGVELAIQAMGGNVKWPSEITNFTDSNLRNVIPHPRTNVKQLILTMLDESGSEGLNATMIVERAARQNTIIGKSTVSSLLSRYKLQGLITYDGQLYRMKQSKDTSNKEINTML